MRCDQRLLIFFPPLSVVLFLAFGKSDATPVTGDATAAVYLKNYGYLEGTTEYRSSSASLHNADEFTEALLNFQNFAGLKPTGILDSDTLKMMNTPRCGVKDIYRRSELHRRKRYVLSSSKWKKTRLTYRISRYPTRIKDKQRVDNEIAKAFKIWSDVSGLTFESRRRGRVDIDIRFERMYHGDGKTFDGPGGTLAHAFFPNEGGDVHFDDDENWTIGESGGTDLFSVAAHEIGHALGLDHSLERGALMAPHCENSCASGNGLEFGLQEDDIRAIQDLYGKGGTIRSPSRPGETEDELPNTSSAQDLCQDATIDTITRTQDGSMYVFKGEFYWKILPNGIADGYPREISEDWGGLPGNLDASFTRSDGRTFFFKGDQFWRFANRRVDPRYPKFISSGFPGIPSNLDAVVVWSGNGKTYFFKGDKYWMHDSNSNPPVKSDYPLPLSYWTGVPNDIDAAFQWGGQTYFFKDDKYYRFNDDTSQVDSGDPPYPRSTSVWWFVCRPVAYSTGHESNEINATSLNSDYGRSKQIYSVPASSSRMLRVSVFLLLTSSLLSFLR